MTGQYNRVFHHIIRVEVIDIGGNWKYLNISKNARIITIENSQCLQQYHHIHVYYCMLGKKLELNYSRHGEYGRGSNVLSYSICLPELPSCKKLYKINGDRLRF